MKGKKVKGYMKGGDIGDSMPGIEGLDKKFGKSVADANKAAEAATAKRMKGVDLGTEEEQLKAIEKLKSKDPKDRKKKMKDASKKNNTTPAKPKGTMGGAPKPPMGGMGGAPKPPMGGGMPPMGGAPAGGGGMGMPPKKPPMPMMKKGGKVKKAKSGGKVRGAGIAKQGVRACKMR